MKAVIVIDEIRQDEISQYRYIEYSDHTEEKPHCSKTYIYEDL